MNFINKISVNCFLDFFVNRCSAEYAVEYIESEKMNHQFLNWYLVELVKKIKRRDFGRKRDLEVISCVLKNGADKTTTCAIDDIRSNTLINSVIEIRDVDLNILFLPFLKKFYDLRFESEHFRFFCNGNTPLHIVVAMAEPHITRSLLKLGVDCEVKNYNLETPLFIAVEGNLMEQVKILLEVGADFKVRDENGDTILHKLCRQEKRINLEMFKMLLDIGCDINSIGRFGFTPLHLLAMFHYKYNAVSCAKLLIQRGAKINLQDESGNTALHTLMYNCDIFLFVPFLNLLMESEIDVKIVNSQNKTFFDVLMDCHFRRITVLKHLVVLNVSGKCQMDFNPTSNNYILFDLEVACRSELYHLESRKIFGLDCSYLRILSSHRNQISKLCNNPILRSTMITFNEQEFPIYGRRLRKKFQAGLKIFHEEENASKFLSVISNGRLNFYCMKEILKYIPTKEYYKYEKCLPQETIAEEASSSNKRKANQLEESENNEVRKIRKIVE
ncbi:ankyrin repeat domain-containing protein 18B-like [Harmonia axyridis]|uniref:ankyrin repeat domain-containing protein 18B-like n=1 Tax=Harmonia axyridis TaxID=115357 RepID=UPI001E276625|nr:ankyrin repeat domain-containing protein 18B-like [Harmonia axyridis]